ncbi:MULTISPECIES: DUF190 domain-containing protein [Dethiosulfovibrio]|uniref:DUF190 domain-containing protein n=2 Tax=Dethiosulfovibrio TaxID=47054 RepID=A0ABS9ESZ9_9BACT|nr:MULTISPECIES: DUF190 domain-containing protein [Dethiosulfovibrio]MCF4114354.1 DUF190 domain-containing protein [Dethiosulfovibrio russensis]MCF4142985.1 DUF190 domain-containing protein [Dethiosulfovibrio marinus]MCF4145082.1 DUF190 domain-containing protein [Dethiosulfovibrio acidaminovorans]
MTVRHEEWERFRIYIGESDYRNGRPLYRYLLEEARRRGLAGATVFKGLAGFGAGSKIHFAEVLRLSEDLPIVIDIVDTPEKLDDFASFLDEAMDGGMVLRESVHVDFYRPSRV